MTSQKQVTYFAFAVIRFCFCFFEFRTSSSLYIKVAVASPVSSCPSKFLASLSRSYFLLQLLQNISAAYQLLKCLALRKPFIALMFLQSLLPILIDGLYLNCIIKFCINRLNRACKS